MLSNLIPKMRRKVLYWELAGANASLNYYFLGPLIVYRSEF
jgi:hypothetical protein